MSEPTVSSKQRLVVLVDNLSTNSLSRGYVLAKLLAQDFNVRIAGVLPAGAEVWPPCPHDLPIQVLATGAPSWRELGQIARRLEADVLVPSKSLKNSFGLALLARRHRDRPLMLDMDDWEPGCSGLSLWGKLMETAVQPRKWHRTWTLALDHFTGRADAITVASSWLQQRYGGRLLPHVRDATELDPSRRTGVALRKRLGLEQNKVVLFLGTPREHKGLEEAASALDRLGRDDVRFLIVGAQQGTRYTREVLERLPLVVLLPPYSMPEAPDYLAAADVVVIPQRDTPFSRAQLPGKLIDAMAMARPIIGTAVSDIPRLLEGCGLVVPPGDVPALTEAFRWMFDHPAEAMAMGQRARERMVRGISYEAGRPVLLEAVQTAVERYKSRASPRRAR